MFRGLINDAKTAATSVIAKYLARASVVVPFLIAVGFAIAAITHMLIAHFGAVVGCWILAAGFTLVGVMAMLFVKHKEQEEEVAEQQAEASDTAEVASDAAAQALVQMPMALVGALLSTPVAPKAIAGSAKVLLRNFPLVILMGLLALLFWPAQGDTAKEAGEGEDRPSSPFPEANGAYRPRGNGLNQDRAA
jgi:phosphotransferase system  glucose/maltose/N-acetylglucosamine-specific IIC component